jgi:hypothetical protein
MAGITFIEHKGRRVLMLDFSRVHETAEALGLMAQAKAMVSAQPKRKELLTVVDVQGMRVNEEILKAFVALATHNAPWVLASAVAIPNQLGQVITRAQGVMANRTLKMFDTRTEALDWVVAEAAKATAPAAS